MGAELFRADGETDDRHDEGNTHFWQFSDRACK